MLSLLRKSRASSAARPSRNRTLRPSRDVLTAEQGGLTVLLDLRREIYLGLDEVGAAIWREVEAGAGPLLIAERLRQEYDAPAEVLRLDVERFLAELEDRGLVEQA
jgi:hypothetical protein